MISKDFIIVGQGIAGSLLAWFLQRHNKSFIIIDDARSNTSSRIAAGIMHPVTGRRIVKTWMADLLFPFAEKTYREIENQFSNKIFYPTPIIELLSNAKEFNDWMARSNEQDLGTYIDPSFADDAYDDYLQPFFKKILIKKSAWIDTSSLLTEFKNYFQKENNLLNEKFLFSELLLNESGVIYKDFSASKIIFCDGVEAKNNPYWKMLPFLPSKGEIITIRADMKLNHILNRKIFILPIDDNHCRVGSTYTWNFEIPFEVVDHTAAVRPTVKDRRPMLGLHNNYSQVGIFNGLGAKGCLLAPFFADHFAGYLSGKNELMKEVDVMNQ